MLTPMSYFNLIDACSEPGCPVCRLLRSDADRALDAMMYENANEPESHLEFRNGRGLCNTHGWQLTQYAGYSLGTAILYKATINEVLKVMQQTANQPPLVQKLVRRSGRGAALADALEPTTSCFVCKTLSIAEPTYIQIFAQSLGDEKFLAAYRNSDGLCLPHFRQLLRRVDESDVQTILAIQQSLWERLEAELKLFADKNIAERMHEAIGQEGDSWQRAIGSTSGQPNVFSMVPRPVKR
jgi:hypothetical protein